MKIFKASRPPSMTVEEFEDAVKLLEAATFDTTVIVTYPSGEYVLSVGTYCYKSNKKYGEEWKCLVEAKSYSVYRNFTEIEEDYDEDDYQCEPRSPFGEQTTSMRYRGEAIV